MLRLRLRANALLLLAPLFLALSGCDELTGNGNDDERDHDPQLVGEWVAISGLFTSLSNASVEFDMITEGGGFMAITFSENGTVALTEYDPEPREMIEDGGTWYTDGTRLIIEWESDPGPDTVSYQVTDSRVVIDVGEEDIDLNDDGSDDLANFVVTFANVNASPDPDLVGSWQATAMTFTSAADPSVTVEVTQYGAAFTLNANADGTYTVAITYPDDTGTYTETESGVFTALEGLLWVHDTGSADPEVVLLFYDIDGATATLSHLWDEEFDFDDDGIEEPATMVITLAAM